MDGQGPNETTMSYGQIPLPDRRDTNLDASVSTPFQTHQSLGQALGPHLPSTVGARPYQADYRLSPSPPLQNGQNRQVPSNTHSPLTFAIPQAESPGIKRKQPDGIMVGHIQKKRREADEGGDVFESDIGAQGAKHWTDDEKSKLFHWLMGPGQDDHWKALRATKNSCLRECAIEVFGSKKTYQALKGCYERNFNLFSQIFAFESFHEQAGSPGISMLGEADRLREYERRLQTARKGGCNVGNITARAIDHWHRIGWYDLFYNRWHADPAATRRAASRHGAVGATASGPGDDADLDEEPMMEYPEHISHESTSLPNGLNGHPTATDPSHSMPFVIPHPQKEAVPPQPPPPPPPPHFAQPPPTVPSNPPRPPDQNPVNITINQGMIQAFLAYLQTQTQTNKMKLEYMRRREEREETESAQRREIERMRLERETAQWEHNKHSADIKQKADRAIELLGNPAVDSSVKQAAGDYLKKLFATE